MGIQNFPASLQPIIQQGFLEREFEQALKSRLGYRMIADRETFNIGIGETITKTRAGLKPTVTTPLSPSANTNLDNGLTSAGWAVEQYTLTLNFYAATQDLNMVTSRVGIANQFLQNAYANGEQAARSMDELARNALFNAYFGGNTSVRTTAGGAGTSVVVDDIRGFTTAYVNGVAVAVSSGNPLNVLINGVANTVTGYSADATSVSVTPNGVSGTLTVGTSVSVANNTAGNTVLATNASAIIRPSGRGNSTLLQSTDLLTMSQLLDAVAALRKNAVPEIDGAFNCYLDPVSARQLFADPDFKQLFQGATSAASAFKSGMVNDFLGLRFMPTTEAFVQSTAGGFNIRRPIICGQGALIEGDFAGIAAEDIAPKDSIINIVDGVAMVTREPIDRLQQIIAQSWYWIGGFVAPSDTTTTSDTVPTATSATFKRAVMIEHAAN